MERIWSSIERRYKKALNSPKANKVNCLSFGCFLLGLPYPKLSEYYIKPGVLPFVDKAIQLRMAQVVTPREPTYQSPAEEDLVIGFAARDNSDPHFFFHMSIRHPDPKKRRDGVVIERRSFQADIRTTILDDVVRDYLADSDGISLRFYRHLSSS